MKEIVDQLMIIKNSFYNEGKSSLENEFFNKSILHMSITFEIAIGNFNNKNISYEVICQNIPKKIGSRSSIQNIINQGVHLNFFFKEKLAYDKRIKVLSLTKNFNSMIISWVRDQKINFI